MASVFAHTAVAICLGDAFSPRRRPWKFWPLAIVCSCLPDGDVVGFVAGIEYGSTLGHRGLTHSLPFAAVVGMAVTCLFFREFRVGSAAWWRLSAVFFVITGSHGVLDAMTNGGKGVAFFSPFWTRRFFLPWRPVLCSPVGIRSFFTRWGLDVLRTEMMWIVLPAMLLAGVARLARWWKAPCMN